jgi:hypothetical protein
MVDRFIPESVEGTELVLEAADFPPSCAYQRGAF